MMMSPTAPHRLHSCWAGIFASALALVVIAISAGSLAAQEAKADDPILAKVDGVEIRQSDLTIAENAAGQLPPMDADTKRDYLVQFITDLILVAKAAEEKKLNASSDFEKKIEFARRRLLMESLLSSAGKEALTEPAMRQVYDDAVKQMTPEDEVHARHILIRAAAGDEKASKEAESKIKTIIERLNKGEDFVKVANEVTEDPSGKNNGGDLGYFTKDQMVPEFAEAAFKLESGKISAPVKTQFGWHVIKVEDKRTKPAPAFDDVKPQIEQHIVRKAHREFIIKLRDSAKIEKMYETKPPADATKTDAPAVPENAPPASPGKEK